MCSNYHNVKYEDKASDTTLRLLLSERTTQKGIVEDVAHEASVYPQHSICQDRICSECGNDHSLRNNFAGVITSIDLIPELLFGKKEVFN